MTEGLFVLTTLFVAYVIYVIVNEKKAGSTATKSTAAVAPSKQQASVAEKPAVAVIKPNPVPAAKPAVAKPVAAAKKPAVAAAPKPAQAVASKPVAAAPAPKPAVVAAPEAIKGSGLKDPKTGEVATTYSNYRFTKRWIKEALVEEKLVDKVYKNDELNAGVEAKIKAGLAKLEGMKKYKP
jgi:hypothetical protein